MSRLLSRRMSLADKRTGRVRAGLVPDRRSGACGTGSVDVPASPAASLLLELARAAARCAGVTHHLPRTAAHALAVTTTGTERYWLAVFEQWLEDGLTEQQVLERARQNADAANRGEAEPLLTSRP